MREREIEHYVVSRARTKMSHAIEKVFHIKIHIFIFWGKRGYIKSRHFKVATIAFNRDYAMVPGEAA